MRDFPNLKAKSKEVNQASHGCSNANTPKKNRVFALQAREGANLD